MNDANYSACRFSADIVPYMYGELVGSESSVFESHLLQCGECTDEFAAISGARYEVYEWKKLAFDPLATPRFTIPMEAEVVSVSSATWLDKVRAAVSTGWATPAFAIGGLIIVSMYAASFIFSERGVPEVASNIENVRTVDATAGPEPVLEAPEYPRADDGSDGDARRFERKTVETSTANRASDRRRVSKTKEAPPRAVKLKAESARTKPIDPPRLNEFAEDEDTSLRLAELLDEIETSD